MSAAELVEDMHAVVKSVSIEALLRARDRAMEGYRRIVDEYEAIRQTTGTAGAKAPRVWLAGDCYRGQTLLADNPGAMETLQRELDASFWQHLLHESGLRTFMDAKARTEWDESIANKKVPPLTRETIEATFSLMYDTRGQMFERGVIDCFRRLSWHYKTNQPFKFGKRIIVTGLVRAWGPEHRRCDELDDLVRVFSVLDGTPEPDHRHGISRYICEAQAKKEREADTPFMSMRWFKNGNGHITFRRLDLVDQLNAIIAKHYPGALPDARREAA